MKIKEVEKKVGITSRNIRYYEQEGLVRPERNKENNYREYSERDVEQLERIKILRLLGVPITDIKEIDAGIISLEEAMQRRLDGIHEEKQSLDEAEKVCEMIIQRDLQMDALNEEILGGQKKIWREQLEEILEEDITREMLGGKRLNRNIGGMLAWGYVLNTIVALLFGDYLFWYNGEKTIFTQVALAKDMQNWNTVDTSIWAKIIVIVGLLLICGVGIHFTSSVKIHLVFFHISALILTPLMAFVYLFIRTAAEDTLAMSGSAKAAASLQEYLQIEGKHVAVFWGLICLFVLAVMLISETWSDVFNKVLYTLGVILGGTVIMTMAAGLICGKWILYGVLFLIVNLYIGLNWMHIYQDYNPCSRYYVIVSCSRIINVGIKALNMRGRANTPMYID